MREKNKRAVRAAGKRKAWDVRTVQRSARASASAESSKCRRRRRQRRRAIGARADTPLGPPRARGSPCVCAASSRCRLAEKNGKSARELPASSKPFPFHFGRGGFVRNGKTRRGGGDGEMRGSVWGGATVLFNQSSERHNTEATSHASLPPSLVPLRFPAAPPAPLAWWFAEPQPDTMTPPAPTSLTRLATRRPPVSRMALARPFANTSVAPSETHSHQAAGTPPALSGRPPLSVSSSAHLGMRMCVCMCIVSAWHMHCA